jgi:Multiprotein bridging factor 1
MGDNDWDTVTKIGFKTGSTRQTTVKGSAAINAAARTGSLSSEKKFTGTNPPPELRSSAHLRRLAPPL